ncbi:hypothetical protein PHLCEN_2v4375 [Hermanssonia centrifuga]|uniref:MFS transporter n=1 Tax=Hermanssonia centrifuga TaxID=98765 RepID=A0A2R6PV81_9APHY|nr:hypothetical protein PHLCEN_2v4375 [Hermanssonia centrifuga]
MAISVPFASISLFTPTIISGLGYEGLNAQLFTVPPYAISFVVTLLLAWQTDKHNIRAWGSVFALAAAGASFLAQGALPPDAFTARYGLLCVSVTFAFACVAPILSWLTGNLRNTGASTLAVPLNVSIGQFGQIIGVNIYKTSEAPGYPTGHFTNAAFLIGSAIVVLILRGVYVHRNRQLVGQDGALRWKL